ncbi:MAG: glucose-1-phosphate thymidylyltransferase RfbA, partial [Woeseiaceae bacterium]
KICCPEEIAYQNGFIDEARVLELADQLGKSGYGAYLRSIIAARQPA